MRRLLALPRDAALQAEFVRAGAGAVQFVLLARLLTLSDFGRLAVLNFVLSVAAPFLSVNVNMMLVRALTLGLGIRLALRRVLGWALLGAGVSLLALVVLPLGLHWPLATKAVLLLAFVELTGNTFLTGICALWQAQGRFDRARTATVVSALGRITALAALLPVHRHSAVAYAELLAAATVVTTVVIGATTRVQVTRLGRTEDTGPTAPPHVFRQRPRESLVFAANALSVRVLDDVDKAILAIFEGYGVVALYTAAYRVASYILVPTRGVLTRYVPRLFGQAAADPAGMLEVRRKTAHQLRFVLVIAGGALGLLTVPAPWIVGSGYRGVRPYALVLIPLLALRGFHYMWGDMLTALGRVRVRLAAQVLSLSIPVAAYFALIPLIGIWGAVVATGVGEVTTILVMSALAHRALGQATSTGTSGGRAPSALENPAGT